MESGITVPDSNTSADNFRVCNRVVCTTFSKTHGLSPLYDAFFNADHDELIEIYIFFKKNATTDIICVEKKDGMSKNQNVKIISRGPKRCKMMRIPNVAPKFKLSNNLPPFVQKTSKIGNITDLAYF